MRLRSVRVIARREYLARVKTKGFWLGTIALPLFLAAVAVLPTLFITKSRTSQSIVIVDETGLLAERLEREFAESADPLGNGSEFFVEIEKPAPNLVEQRAWLDNRVREGDVDAWIWIDQMTLSNNRIEYHAESVSNFLTQSVLEDAVSDAVREFRLGEAGYDPEEIRKLTRSIGLTTVRVTEEGSKEEGAEAGFILAYALFLILYMVLLIYGQQVMHGVLEEKTSRIVEVIVSATSPFELMMGKLVGICLVALSQLAIWLGTLVVITLPGVVASMAWLPEDFDIPTIGGTVLVHFFLLFLLGFFLFSTIYAAIGAAFNNMQEAQQFASVAVIFLVAPMLFFYLVINDPDSPLAVITSLIPLFTPLIMLLRIALKMPPFWQVALGYLLTTAFAVFMVWMTARIYRTGILMYGKKPTFKELWRWLRYA